MRRGHRSASRTAANIGEGFVSLLALALMLTGVTLAVVFALVETSDRRRAQRGSAE
jgi:hypothetical protein